MEDERNSSMHDNEQELRIKKKIYDELEETYHGQERRRQQQGPKILVSIDRWGPGVIALLTLLAVIAVGWTYGERISRVEGTYGEMRFEMGQYQKQIQANDCSQQIKAIEAKAIKDREDWEFAVAKLDNFDKTVTRILIKMGLLD